MNEKSPVQHMAEKLSDWRAVRAELADIERAEHPDITDRFGRVWTWSPGHYDIYVHDCLAWSRTRIMHPDVSLPPATLADNPNYSSLCELCRSEWMRP